MEYFKSYWDDLQFLGYKSDLTAFNYAYDWRLDADTVAKEYRFNDMVKFLYTFTGKKIVVAGHSYGVNVGYQGLYLMKSEDRIKMIDSFVNDGLTGRFLGQILLNDQNVFDSITFALVCNLL